MDFFGICKGMIETEFPNVYVEEMYEKRFASFYDSFASTKEDIVLYKRLTNIYGKNVLDLGCGTGRVSIPLAEDGCNVTAVDISEDMLIILKDKLKDKKCFINIRKADMCEVKFKDPFQVVILPVGTIILIPDKEKLFANVYQNLQTGGVFVFSYFNYDRIKTSKTLNPLIFFDRKEDSFCIMTENVNIEKNVSTLNIFLEEVLKSGTAHHYITSANRDIITNTQIDHLIKKSKFKEIESYKIDTGDYDMVHKVLIKI